MTCAVERGGGVWCWGSNDHGQLGNNTQQASAIPVRVVGINSALTVTTGGTWTAGGMGAALSAFACAPLRDGTLAWWGNSFNWLLDSRISYTSTPLQVAGISDAVAVAGGNWHACALSNGSVLCWGDDRFGQLGDGMPATCAGAGCPAGTGGALTPVRVSGVEGALAIAGHGSDGTCAVLPDASVWCWGSITGGAGSDAVQPVPALVPGVSAAANGLAVGFHHACAVSPSGTTVQCWGDNYAGELGNLATDADSSPVSVAGLATSVVAIAAGLTHTCAVLVDGGVQCWGDNRWGELGDGRLIGSALSVTVSGISDAVAVSAGYLHTCALTKAGRVLCWGQNGAGQIGNGDVSGRAVSTPVAVSGF